MNELIPAFSNAALEMALAALLLYGFLRFVAWSPGSRAALPQIQSHALWTAVIAFFASSTNSLAALGRLPEEAGRVPASWGQLTAGQTVELAVDAAGPAFWLGACYVIGQHTWPKPAGPVRRATLEVRRVRDYPPRGLAALFACCTASAVAAAASMLWMPGRAGTPGAGTVGDLTAEVGMPGLLPGSIVGTALLGGLALLVGAVALAARVIVRRPPLSALEADDSRTLRRIWLNRLLRTASLVAFGFTGAALAYRGEAAAGPGSLLPLALPQLQTAHGIGTAVLVAAVLLWAPPTLRADRDSAEATQGTFRAAQYHQHLALFFATILAVVGWVVAAPLRLPPEAYSDPLRDEQGRPAGPFPFDAAAVAALQVLIVAGLYLACLLIMEFLLARAHGDPRRTPPDHSALLPGWLRALALALVALTATTLGVVGLSRGGATLGPALTAAACLLAVGALVLALAWLARVRRPLGLASPLDDRETRMVTVHRAVRALGAASLALLAQLIRLDQHTFPWLDGALVPNLLLGAAVVLCYLPARMPGSPVPRPALAERSSA
ncbi:hypothetical protein GCM10022377_09650 [Zhihengliuella alba]|uniref:Uncharacterized protein n=1 Tax=Zhihengliuella alba TaxID=547018 RepID=A0ABP7D2X8_9MICC